MDEAWVGAVTGLGSIVLGLLGWQLSARAQRHAEQRQEQVDHGAFQTNMQTYTKELIGWYRTQAAEIEAECEERCQERLDRAAADHARELRFTQRTIDYWKRRALGTLTVEDTPPPDANDDGAAR
jgi:hypothetical protein